MTTPTDRVRAALEEEWRVFPLDDVYEVSNHGQVRNRETGYIIKQRKNSDGYMVVSLRKYSPYKSKLVSRMVAITFLGQQDMVVDHIDNNPENNRLDNLQYMTNEANLKKSQRDTLRPNVTLRKSPYVRSKPWMARIYRDGKVKGLGSYATKEEAVAAWLAAFNEHNGRIAPYVEGE